MSAVGAPGGPGPSVVVEPGDGIAVVGPALAALVRAGPDATVVRRLWAVARSEGAFADAIAALGLEGFATLPDLALTGWDGPVRRVVVRGATWAEVGAGDARGVVDGTGVHTWAEQAVPHDVDVVLHLDPPHLPHDPAAAAAGFELDRGLTPAARVTVAGGRRPEAAPVAPPPWPAPAPPPPGPDPSSSRPAAGGRPADDVPIHTQPVGPPPAPPTDELAALRPPPPVPPPPVPPPAPPPAAPAPTGDVDHDGRTVSLADLVARRADRPATSRTDVSPSTTTYLAVRCPRGHVNPVHASTCRACGEAVPPQDPEPMATLDLGRFRFSTGAEVPVLRPMLIGRAPKVSGPIRGDVPELVAVPSPDADVSRTHVEVRLEGWQVLVIDRGSTNGTVVQLPGRAPQRLRPDHPFPLPVGGRVSLAGEVDFTLVVP